MATTRSRSARPADRVPVVRRRGWRPGRRRRCRRRVPGRDQGQASGRRRRRRPPVDVGAGVGVGAEQFVRGREEDPGPVGSHAGVEDAGVVPGRQFDRSRIELADVHVEVPVGVAGRVGGRLSWPTRTREPSLEMSSSPTPPARSSSRRPASSRRPGSCSASGCGRRSRRRPASPSGSNCEVEPKTKWLPSAESGLPT